MSESKSTPQADNDEIDIGQIFRNIWGGKWQVLILSLFTGAIGAFYAITLGPVFVGNALLQIETKSSGLAALTNLSDAFGSGDSVTSTELELLRSRKVILPTIEKYKLYIVARPSTYPYIGGYFFRKFNKEDGISEPLLAEYFESSKGYAWGGEEIIVNLFDIPEKLYGISFSITNLGNDKYSLFNGGTKILDGTVGVPHHIKDLNIKIQIGKLESRDGTRFSVQRFNKILLANSLAASISVSEKGKKSGIVSISLQGSNKVEIKQTVDHILTTYQQQNIEYNSIEASKSLDFVEEQLPEATGKLKKSEEELYEYRLNNKTIDLSVQSQQLLDQLLSVVKELNELALNEAELSRKFKKEHPIYIEYLHKISDLNKKKSNLDAQAAQIPTEQFNIFRLQRNVELNQTIYLQMLNKYEELKIIKAGTLGSIRIIDDTFVNPSPVKPKKRIIVAVAIIIGAFLAIANILLRSMFFKGIESISQLEELGYNVYASIPYSALEEKLTKQKLKNKEVNILSHMHPDELAVEALRGLRTSLHFAMMEAENNIIMITGPSPGIGKSFISQNLATLLAQSDNKVLLVDLDLRRGRIHHRFGRKVNPGISEYLSGTVEFEDICEETHVKGLDVITRGKSPTNPSELLMGKNFAEFCKTYQEKYDFIILDTPPVLAVTDSSIVGKFAGTTMIVVKQKVTHLKEVEISTSKLNLVGVKTQGYIFNAIQKTSGSQYDYYQYDYSAK